MPERGMRTYLVVAYGEWIATPQMHRYDCRTHIGLCTFLRTDRNEPIEIFTSILQQPSNVTFAPLLIYRVHREARQLRRRRAQARHQLGLKGLNCTFKTIALSVKLLAQVSMLFDRLPAKQGLSDLHHTHKALFAGTNRSASSN